jgi:hypothetical protein
MADKLAPKPQLGMRVINRLDQRTALVVGKPETIGTLFSLIPVTVESSTRTELWAEHWVDILPKRQQFPAHGGRFQAPAGYPLRIQ